MMNGADENAEGVHGTVKNILGIHHAGKFAVAAEQKQVRRPLRVIDRNIIGDSQNSKRALVEKQAFAQKSQCLPAHRPITRKFAAQLVNDSKQNAQSEIQESRIPLHPNIEENDDCTIIDAEPYDITSSDFSAPMFVQHTEAMMEEIDRMEIEMEDIAEEVVDIDECEKNNPLAVVEYVDDMYAFFKRMELLSCVPTNYMEKQCDINERMRGILIDWLIEVHYKFELMEETLYLTVNLIDRFLSVHQVVRKKLQLVGVTAMLIACKYEEVSVPVVSDLILISDRAYSRKEVLEMEVLMVNTLQFNLSLPTPCVFMRRFLKAAQSDKKLELLSFFIIELCLVEYEMLRFTPSLLAAAAIYTSRCAISGYRHWDKTCEWYTAYKEVDLLECARLMVNFHRNAATGKLTGVHRKYSTSRFGYAAKFEPANFLL